MSDSDPMDCITPGLPVPHHLLKLAQVHVHCIGDAIHFSSSDTLFSFCPQSFPASGTFPVTFVTAIHIGHSHQMTKILEIQLQHQSFQGVFKVDLPHGIDCFDLLAVQGAFWSPIQHHSSKASILWHSCLLYGPALTIIHDHWEDHSLSYMDLDYTDLIYFNDTKKLKTKRTTPLRTIQNPNVILYRKSETYY